MSDNKSFNRLYLLIIILIVAFLSLISGFALGSYATNSAQQTQITETEITDSNCTLISSLPYMIEVSGSYCLTSSLTTDSDGIIINTDSVLVDFHDFSIHGSQDPNNTFNGIYANNRSHITIKNGEITGFLYAMRLDDSAYGLGIPYQSGWHTIENMEISQSTFRGIFISGSGNVVQDNIIRHIQGNLLFENSFAIAIESAGPGALIQNNYIYEIRGMGIEDIAEGVGISLSIEGDGSIVTNNILANNSLEESDLTEWSGLSRSTWGIWVGGTTNATISYNQIHNYMFGISFTDDTTDSLIYNNSVMSAYRPYIIDIENIESGGTDEQAHTAYNNICDFEDCFPSLDPSEEIPIPTRGP